MEIRELDLQAFGPFTDRKLVFKQESGGLHIVYGANEAGKSSALRGLKALLYSVDERTGDDFIHARDKLRVGGRLRNMNGTELAFVRRKGRKNTLLAPDGQALADDALSPFLQGVSAELFAMLFAIDHRALVQGGQEILEQKGELGQALFAAALGSQALHGVLAQLDAEADGLFKPRGSAQVINQAVKSYHDTLKAIREQSLSSRDWDQQRMNLERTTEALAQLQVELEQERTLVNRLQRIQRALPRLAARAQRLQQLAALGNVLVLAEDFAQRRQRVGAELEQARVMHQQASGRCSQLQSQLESMSVQAPVLELSATIEDLHARLGAYLKALQDRPHLVAECRQREVAAESLIKAVRSDLTRSNLDQLQPLYAGRQRLIDLGGKSGVLAARRQETERVRLQLERQTQETRAQLEALPELLPLAALQRAVAAARKRGDLDQALAEAQREWEVLQAQCAKSLARLPLWSGTLQELAGLPLPNRETITHFDDRYTALAQRQQRLQDKHEETEAQLLDLARRFDAIQRAGAVPNEDDLTRARTVREQAWQLLRRQWLGGEDVAHLAQELDAGRALPEAFEWQVTHADELADRLRREADRVHAQANLLADQMSASQRQAQIAAQLQACRDAALILDADWAAAWQPCGIAPRTPREMRAWLEQVEKLTVQIDSLAAREQEVRVLRESRTMHLDALRAELGLLGKMEQALAENESLEALLLICTEVLDEGAENQRKQESLAQDLGHLERQWRAAQADQQAAQNEHQTWQEQWRTALTGFGLGDDRLPSEVMGMIETLQQLFVKQGEIEQLQIRIQGIDHDAATFNQQVAELVAQIAPDLTGQPVADRVLSLNALLVENRARSSRRLQVAEQLTQARQELLDSATVIEAMTAQLDALCQEARCTDPAELEWAERRSADYQRLLSEINTLEQELLNIGEGATLVELEAAAAAHDPDRLAGQIQALTERIESELEPRRMQLAESKGRETKALEMMDGGDAAAVLAEQAQASLAEIRSSAEHYVRLRLAARILRAEIERYRKVNQGPLLSRASEHFATLTGHSFAELRADFNEKDEPVLVGIRPTQERVRVEGMSSGTRDQLYLALRLASLEKYLESAEPMPFIVDDILVDFDDQRAESALRAFADLAQKTQVILFTHHSRVVEQAQALPSSNRVQVHTLNNWQ